MHLTMSIAHPYSHLAIKSLFSSLLATYILIYDMLCVWTAPDHRNKYICFIPGGDREWTVTEKDNCLEHCYGRYWTRLLDLWQVDERIHLEELRSEDSWHWRGTLQNMLGLWQRGRGERGTEQEQGQIFDGLHWLWRGKVTHSLNLSRIHAPQVLQQGMSEDWLEKGLCLFCDFFHVTSKIGKFFHNPSTSPDA